MQIDSNRLDIENDCQNCTFYVEFKNVIVKKMDNCKTIRPYNISIEVWKSFEDRDMIGSQSFLTRLWGQWKHWMIERETL